MTRSVETYLQQRVERYEAAKARGEHDASCEYDPRGFYLCHCSKRRRVARGLVEVPTEPLDFPPPSCTNCYEPLEHDEGWNCPPCSLQWDADGNSPEFTDDYGEEFAQEAREWSRQTDEIQGKTRDDPRNPDELPTV